VRKIAELARLDLAAEEEASLARQFATILDHFKVLASLDVSGVEAGPDPTAGRGISREDLPRPGLPVSEVLRNAPAHTAEFFVVPKTVGGEEGVK